MTGPSLAVRWRAVSLPSGALTCIYICTRADLQQGADRHGETGLTGAVLAPPPALLLLSCCGMQGI